MSTLSKVFACSLNYRNVNHFTGHSLIALVVADTVDFDTFGVVVVDAVQRAYHEGNFQYGSYVHSNIVQFIVVQCRVI